MGRILNKSLLWPATWQERLARLIATVVIVQSLAMAVITAQVRQQAIVQASAAQADYERQSQIDRLNLSEQSILRRLDQIDQMDIPVKLAVLRAQYDNINTQLSQMSNLIYTTLFSVIGNVAIAILLWRSQSKGRQQ